MAITTSMLFAVATRARRALYSAYFPIGSVLAARTLSNDVRIGQFESATGGHVNEEIAEELRLRGIETSSFGIDIADYRHYMLEACYSDFPHYCAGWRWALPEKSLEHYLAAKVLELCQDDVYIDVASANSPVPQIYERLFGCRSYKQDRRYAVGLHGKTIGGDAASMPVADGFATKMGLHCSFEHFEKDGDIRFIREANRVLRPGGKLCIVPLYMSQQYTIQSDPAAWLPWDAPFEPHTAVRLIRGSGERHCRSYDIEHFLTRVVANCGPLRPSVFIVSGQEGVDRRCYVKFIGLFEKE